jgi:UDP-N-acetylglucosamine--N-acetylmuramyl-(pentapeptide) pyrophosphoryl-undecaprenol N-acetylglucosamine transferase
MKRLILTTGGTGGHIFPALAIAEAVKTVAPDCEILFVGGDKGPEGRWAAKAGLEFVALPARGVMGRGFKSLGALVWLAKSMVQAWRLIGSYRPDVVLGLGGYAGFACTLAASLRGVPTAIHEQNSVPGITNRVLARWVDRILVSFEDMEASGFPSRKVVLTGNPTRGRICSLRDNNRPMNRNVLVVGGSQGASALNRLMVREMDGMKAMGLRIWHQTGRDEYESVREAYARTYPEARVDAFIDDMHEAYEFADLVVCRAGATTIAELTAAGKPSILVPFPYATHDHQLKNAKFLEKKGAALLFQQSQLEQIGFASAVADLFEMPERLLKMGRAAREMGNPDAGKMVVSHLQELAMNKKDRVKSS